MSVRTAGERIAELRAMIAHHDELYFKKAAPEISDYDYDRLKEELIALEREHPEHAGSVPKVTSSDDRTGRFPTARHRMPMAGLEKTYDEAALRAFHARIVNEIGQRDVAFVIEPKYDGIAISIVYEHGRFVRAVTRGDGATGDDITENIRTIEDVPETLVSDGTPSVPEYLEVRGEIFLSFAAFAGINREREASGEPLFANPRNAAAGTAKLSAPAAVAGRGLDIVFFGIGAIEPAVMRPPSQQELLTRLRSWGLPTIQEVRVARDADGLWDAVRELGAARPVLPFPTDGAVVKLDDMSLREHIGERFEAPRWAMAFKFAPLRVSTRVHGITIQVGRTGLLTPVVELEPVLLAGSMVSRASLHNGDALARADVRIGDTVFVEKAGEIIPVIVGVDHGAPALLTEPFHFPVRCPACRSEVQAADRGVLRRCPNEACPAQVRRRLEHFASTAGVNIEGLGPATIDALVARGWVDDAADLYRVRREALMELGADVAVSSDALLAAIARSRSAELWRIIHGLSIPRVGEITARDLAAAYIDLEAFAKLDARDFASGGCAHALELGRATEEALVAWFADDRHRGIVRELAELGLGRHAPETQTAGRALVGKVFVLTGRLDHLSRTEATDRIRAAGGRVAASVTRRTDFVVAGDGAGEKLARARELGVRVIDEAALLRLLDAE